VVPVERVEGGDLDAGGEVLAALGEPVGVGLLRAARDQVQQPGPDLPVLIDGQVDHAGQLLRAATALLGRLGGHVVPQCSSTPKVWTPAKRDSSPAAAARMGSIPDQT